MSPAIWTVARDGKQLEGKRSSEDVRFLARDATEGSMLIWKEGMQGWKEPGEVPELDHARARTAGASPGMAPEVFELPAFTDSFSSGTKEPPEGNDAAGREKSQAVMAPLPEQSYDIEAQVADIFATYSVKERIFGKKAVIKRQIIISAISAVFLSFMLGTSTMDALGAISSLMLTFPLSFLFVGRGLSGWWPVFSYFGSRIMAFTRTVLGAEESRRRRLILSGVFLIWVPVLIYATSDYAAWKVEVAGFETYVTQSQEQGMTLDMAKVEDKRAALQASKPPFPIMDSLIILIVLYSVMFYLLGFCHRWKYAGNDAHILLQGSAGFCPELKKQICGGMLHRVISDLQIREVDVKESGVAFSELDVGGLTTKQLEITRHRIRLVLRVQEHGTDLFTRWVSYANFSGRRLWMIIGLIYGFVNRVSMRWFGTGFKSLFKEIRRVLFDRSGEDTTGRSTSLLTKITDEYGLVGEAIDVPSYMLDDLFALEDTVTQLLDQTLNDHVSAMNEGKNSVVSVIAMDVHRASRESKEQAF